MRKHCTDFYFREIRVGSEKYTLKLPEKPLI